MNPQRPDHIDHNAITMNVEVMVLKMGLYQERQSLQLHRRKID
jgi:hypothetical protein